MLAEGYDAQVKFRQEYTKGITKNKVIERCEKFIQTRMEVERKSREERQRQQMAQFTEDLATNAGALLGAKSRGS